MARARAIPKEMNAAAIDRFGPPDVIHLERVPVPAVGKRDILVAVDRAGVGEWEADIADGSFQEGETQFPRVLGTDGAGTVVAAGSSVKRFEPGDRVYGWALGNAKGGFFAEYAAIDEREAAIIPENLAFDEAGALAASGLTALQGLDRLGLEEGENLLIFGASGGVGHVAVQLAKHMGLRVFAVASKEDGVRLVNKLGADGSVEGHSKTLIRKATAFAPLGFAGALVFAGGNGWRTELQLVVKGGRVASPNGVDPRPLVPKGVTLETYDAEDSPEAFDRLNELIARGPFHIEISKTYSLDQAARAIADVQKHHVGKLAIKV